MGLPLSLVSSPFQSGSPSGTLTPEPRKQRQLPIGGTRAKLIGDAGVLRGELAVVGFRSQALYGCMVTYVEQHQGHVDVGATCDVLQC
ncbi:hypothetical protein ASE48_04010 [Mycobacterium sp. Root265]|nr:hypothetical protein ASE48_04010 [Mycobacterium sp. Root265]